MNHPVGYFEIPVSDLKRATAFYQAVFGYEFEWASFHGNEMAMFPFIEGASGIHGALAKGEIYVPSRTGTMVYFNTDNIDATLAKVTALGGSILFEKSSIGELGFVAEFEDSEGNRVALHQPAETK